MLLGNILAQSQSGTGKTATFAITILSRIDPSIKYPQALILVPTFELAIQIGSVIEKLARFLPYIRVAYAVRDSPVINGAQAVLSEPIVIGTPGTIQLWCNQLKIIDLLKLRLLCVDEADLMMTPQGMGRICSRILSRLDQSHCQIMFFSSTYSDELVKSSRQTIQNLLVLRPKNRQMLPNISQYFITCNDKQEKYNAIEQMYANLTIGQAMIFCQTTQDALDLTMKLELANYAVKEIMSILDIQQRETIITKFRQGVFGVLIATNLAARG